MGETPGEDKTATAQSGKVVFILAFFFSFRLARHCFATFYGCLIPSSTLLHLGMVCSRLFREFMKKKHYYLSEGVGKRAKLWRNDYLYLNIKHKMRKVKQIRL